MHQRSQSIAQAWKEFSKTKVAKGREKSTSNQQKFEKKRIRYSAKGFKINQCQQISKLIAEDSKVNVKNRAVRIKLAGHIFSVQKSGNN